MGQAHRDLIGWDEASGAEPALELLQARTRLERSAAMKDALKELRGVQAEWRKDVFVSPEKRLAIAALREGYNGRMPRALLRAAGIRQKAIVLFAYVRGMRSEW